MWVGQLGGGDGLASGTIPDWIAPIMTAIHHLLVMGEDHGADAILMKRTPPLGERLCHPVFV